MIDNSQQTEINARRLILLRKLKGWTIAQAAIKMGIPRPRMASYEQRRAIIPFETIRRACIVYGITLDEFQSKKIPVNVVSIMIKEWEVV